MSLAVRVLIAGDSQAVRSRFAGSSQEFRSVTHAIFSGDPKHIASRQSDFVICGRNVCTSGYHPDTHNHAAEKWISKYVPVGGMVRNRKMHLDVWLLSLAGIIAGIVRARHFLEPVIIETPKGVSDELFINVSLTDRKNFHLTVDDLD